MAAAIIAPLVRAGGDDEGCEPYWDSSPGVLGLNDSISLVYAAPADGPDGAVVYLSGRFRTAYGQPMRGIAKWDGTTLTQLGAGINSTLASDRAFAMTVLPDGDLLVGGYFGEIGGAPGTINLARWDGTTWSSVNGGMQVQTGGVRAFANFQDDLYVGGVFDEIGGVTTNCIARFDFETETFHALPGDPIGPANSVHALRKWDDGNGEALYLGGVFANANGVAGATNIVRFDGSSFTPLGQGTNNTIYAIEVFQGDLYAAGTFNEVYQSDGTPVITPRLARWDGTQWHAMEAGLTSPTDQAYALHAFDDGLEESLFFGGQSSVPAHRLSRYNGKTWSNVSTSNPNGSVRCFASRNVDGESILLVAGDFTNPGPDAKYLGGWRGCAGEVVTNPADLTGDGSVNLFDLLDLLSRWGDCSEACPPACVGDLSSSAGVGTSDCRIDVFDLLALLAAWS